MKYRRLGSTDIKVSEIGFGTWGIGGNSYGNTSDAVSLDALECALERGINFFDTSDLYGDGHAETLLGQALEGRRDKAVIATKGGMLPHTGFYMPQDFSDSHLRKALDASLARLKTDYVDLYLLHSPTMQDLAGGLASLAKLKQEGKIREFGVSARSPADALTAMRDFQVRHVQVNFNIIDLRAKEIGLFDFALKNGVGVIARTPLAFGYLTGHLTGKETFEGQDHRNNWPREQLQRWAAAPGVFSFIHENNGRTPTQAAIMYCLSEPAVSTCIPGMLERAHVLENAYASDLPPMDAEELKKISEVYLANSEKFYDKSFVKVKAPVEAEVQSART